jgi:predicted DNA-binding transcriptional regulator AlpA
MMHNEIANSDRHLGRPIVLAHEITGVLQISLKTLRDWVGKKKFPDPLPMPGRAWRWDRATVEAFLEGRWTTTANDAGEASELVAVEV